VGSFEAIKVDKQQGDELSRPVPDSLVERAGSARPVCNSSEFIRTTANCELGRSGSRCIKRLVLRVCVYRPCMGLEWEQIVVAAANPAALGQWWCEALRWVVVDDDPPVFEIQPQRDQLPGIMFLAVDGPKQETNRLHIDLRPDDQAVEVERLLALGASRVDVGQGDVSWVVLADPEGNEFCVLQSR